MGRRGPPPTPIALKLARGNPGKRAINHEEPKLEAASATCPRGLRGRAKVEWTRLASELIAKGVLTIGDMHAFEEYCRIVGELDKVEKLVSKTGIEGSIRLGYCGYLNKLRTQLRQQAGHLGLTPASRSNVKAAKPKDKADSQRSRFFGARASEA